MAVQGVLITPHVQTTAGSGVSGTLTGALVAEGDYLEPTTGQIWPR